MYRLRMQYVPGGWRRWLGLRLLLSSANKQYIEALVGVAVSVPRHQVRPGSFVVVYANTASVASIRFQHWHI